MEGINIVQTAVASKTTSSFLEGILVEAEETLKLTGFNLEIGIKSTVEADIIERGSLVLPSRLFSDIVRTLPDADIALTAAKNFEVQIDAEGSFFSIRGITAEGYPLLPQVDQGIQFVLPQNILKDMIKKTAFAVGLDQHRVILTGCLIESTGNELNMVAIDGYRVAWWKSFLEKGTVPMKVVIPGKSLSELQKILSSSDEPIRANMSKNYITFNTDKYMFLSRILEGEYLAYKSLIPTEFSTTVRFETARMLESVERACLVTGEDKKMQIHISVASDRMVITAHSDNGNYKDMISVEQEGNDIEIMFNPKFVQDALRAIQDEEKAKICFNSNVHPCVIKPDEGDSFFYMILPLRV